MKGVDLFIYLDGDHHQDPKCYEMKEKMTPEQVHAELGESTTVFVVNKNLQNYPKGLRGSLMWIPVFAHVGYVLYSSDFTAVLSNIYPLSPKGKRVEIDMRKVCGEYLRYVGGPYPDSLPLKSGIRSGQGYHTLVDQNGCIKMSIEGGDIVEVEEAEFPAADQKELHCARMA